MTFQLTTEDPSRPQCSSWLITSLHPQERMLNPKPSSEHSTQQPSLKLEMQLTLHPTSLADTSTVCKRPTNHSNWLNSRFEKIFNPVIGRALVQRPTLVKTRMQVQHYINAESVNPYDLLLCYSEANLEKILEVITDVSSFLKSEAKATKILSQTLENSTGINIMYHTIWSITLPTYHTLSPPTVTSQQDTDEFYRYLHFF